MINKKYKHILFLLFFLINLNFFLFLRVNSQNISKDEIIEIIKKIDKNLVYNSVYYEGKIEIKRGKQTQIKTFELYAKGTNFFIKFTNKEDYNVKYLKKDGVLYIYFPEANDIITISGAMLKQSFMGSDLTYEDITSNQKLLDIYDVENYNFLNINNNKYLSISLIAKTKNVAYFKQELLIDYSTLLLNDVSYFDLANRKIKVIKFKNYKNFGNRFYPTLTLIEDAKRDDYFTIFEITKASFDINIDDNIFIIQNLYKL